MKERILLLLLPVCILVLTINYSYASAQDIIDGERPLGVFSITGCDDPAIEISDKAKAALRSVDFTKCSMPFGILIGADKDMPDWYINTTINVVAEMLDLDRDGIPDNDAAVAELRKWKDRGWLPMPMYQEKWENEQVPKLREHLGYTLITPYWWMRPDNRDPSTQAINQISDPETRAKAVIVEEVTHFIIQFGFGIAYPAQFGVNDWTSVIARETKRAGCDWWQHPQNDCQDSPPLIVDKGDCSGPSCDVSEFYQQVLTLRAGMQPGWFGIGFPRTKEELEAKLSQEMKDLLDDPQYHQNNKPLTFDYVQKIRAR